MQVRTNQANQSKTSLVGHQPHLSRVDESKVWGEKIISQKRREGEGIKCLHSWAQGSNPGPLACKARVSSCHRYRGEIPKLAAIFSRHGEQFGGIRFYSESACVNCIFLRYECVFNRARKAATSATHIKVITRVIYTAHSPHLFSAKSQIPPNCSPCREKNLRGRYWNFGISVSISVVAAHFGCCYGK